MKESVISHGRARKACMAEVLNSKQREKVISLTACLGKKIKMIFLNSMTFRQTFRARIFPRISVLNYLVLMRHPLAAQYFFHRRTASLHRPTGFMRNLAI